MAYLNVVNFAQTTGILGTPAMKGFEMLTPAVYRQSSRTPGYIAHAEPADDRDDLSFFHRDWGQWGPFTVPYYYEGGIDAGEVVEASALSVWRDIASLRAFVYEGPHARAMSKKVLWFAPMKFPGYALWWSSRFPTWKKGAEKLELIHRIGTSPEAFTFASLYDEHGQLLRTEAIGQQETQNQ